MLRYLSSRRILYLFALQVILLCTCFKTAVAQELYLKHFTVDDGLPSNETYQVLQDSTGHLLVATDRGLVRYDGYSFEEVLLERNTPGRPFYYLYKAPANQIFCSGLKGNIYRYQDGGLSQVRVSPQADSIFHHANVLIANTISLSNDSLWVSYNNDFAYNYNIGSCVINPAGQVFRLEKTDGIYFDLQHNFYFRELSNNSLRSLTQPLIITWKDGTVTNETVLLSWPSGYIRRLYCERVGDYYFLCIGRRLLVFKDKKKISDHLFESEILTCCFTSPDRFWLGFQYGGATSYSFAGGIISTPGHRLLGGLSVTSIYHDKQGGTWFGTLENGLYYSFASEPLVWNFPGRLASLYNIKDTAYAGSAGGSILLLKGRESIATVRLPLALNDFVTRLSELGGSDLVVITSGGYYLKKTGRWQFYKSSDNSLELAGPHLLFGADIRHPELHLYRGVGGNILRTIRLPKRIVSMLFDRNRNLWLGTIEGLYRYRAGQLQNYTKLNPAFEERIIDIKELGSGSIAVATMGKGLVLITNGSMTIIDQQHGLLSPIINSMETSGNTIWLGTNKGLSEVIMKGGSPSLKHFHTGDGLPTLDIQEFTIAGGWLYFRWIDKLVGMEIKKLKMSSPHAPPFMTGIKVSGKQAGLKNGAILDHNENDLHFSFNRVNLAGAEHQVFRYMLKGFDETWNFTSEREIKYTSLPPGEYSFIVNVDDGVHSFNTEGANYSFSIRPAFWQRWWFPFLIALFGILIGVCIFRVRVNGIHKKNQLLLDLSENQQRALVQLINPHFIFNVLNTAQAAVLRQDKVQAASVISRFAKLMRLSLELSKEKLVTLDKELELLERYFELEQLRSQETLSFEISINDQINTTIIQIPSMLIQPFVENSIKHGIMHLHDRKGCIRISFYKENGNLACEVDDNGVGRTTAGAINKQSDTTHKSAGIEITIKRLALLHQESRTDYYYEVIDKTVGGEPQGTIVKFYIPYKHKI